MQQLPFRRDGVSPGDDLDLSIEIASAQGDEDVSGVVGKHGGEDASAVDSRFLQRLFAGCIGLEAKKPSAPRLCHAPVVLLQDDEMRAAVLQSLGERHADSPIAADDHVAGEFIDFGVHAPDAQNLL